MHKLTSLFFFVIPKLTIDMMLKETTPARSLALSLNMISSLYRFYSFVREIGCKLVMMKFAWHLLTD